MKIIKKNGSKEEFNILKIRGSVFNTSNEIGMPLTDSDLNLIEKEVKKILETLKREETSSYEVFGIVITVLQRLKFTKVCESYLEGAF